jgi:putative endonuclease
MPGKEYYVYILSNWNNNVVYVGVTNNLERRLFEHKNKLIDGFTKKYNIDRLVYYESTPNIASAIQREKEIKKWRREKKNNLITAMNPEWLDLSYQLFSDLSLRSD